MFPNGLDVSNEYVEEILEKYGVKKHEYILFVGTLSPRKNDKIIVEAYIKYRKAGGTKKMLLAGNIADKSLNVKQMIESSEYKNDIVLSGYISETEKRVFYYHAAMFMFPSRLEGFGFPLLEAMQAEIPVITSNTSCMPEIAEDAAIYLNNIDDSDELKSCIFKIEKLSVDQKQQLIENGLKRVEFFENQNFSEKTYQAFNELSR